MYGVLRGEQVKTHRRWSALLVATLVSLSAWGGGNANGSSFAADAAVTAGSTTPETSQPASTAVDENVDPNATLDIGYIVAPTSLDPAKESPVGQRTYWLPIYDTLFDGSRPGIPGPWLATDMTVSEDGLTATITLREDARFHDGTPVDATAVKASLDRTRTIEGGTFGGALAAITDVTADDPMTVTVTLSSPMPSLRAVLASAAGAIINPAAIASGEDLSLSPGDAGSGPYVVTEFVPNDHVSYERSSTPHWNPDVQQLAGMTIRGAAGTGGASTGNAALQSGEIDVLITLSSREELSPLEGDGFILHQYTPSGVQALNLRNTRTPLDDIRVRQAIAYAVDRESIAEGVFGGDCDASEDLFLTGDPLQADESVRIGYDLDQAKALVEEIGEPIEFTLSTSGQNVSNLISEVLQQQLADAGINVTIEPGTTQGTQLFNQGELDARQTSMFNTGEPFTTIEGTFLESGPFHMAGPDGETLQDLYTQASDPTLSDAEREGMLHEIGNELSRLSVVIPICFAHTYGVANDSVLNLEDLPYAFRFVLDARWLAMAAD